MELTSSLKFVRVGTQKARVVANLVRGQNVNKALTRLAFLNRKSSHIIKKLILSTVERAKQRGHIDIDTLFISKITVDEGPHYKRHLPRAQGRASLIKKKSSHIYIVLDEK